jgi:Flp pilus assembly pilin Flp
MRKGVGLRDPRRGQSTLEYILVVSAILAAVIVAAGLLIKPAVNNMLTESGSGITEAAKKVKPGLGL